MTVKSVEPHLVVATWFSENPQELKEDKFDQALLTHQASAALC